MTTSRTFQEGRCFYLQPLDPCEYLFSTALHVITENGHKAAALLHATFFVFPCKFLVIFYWLRDSSDFVFVIGVQELDSVTHRRLSILFGVFSHIGDYSMFNQLS